MILFAKAMQKRTEHTKASRAERRPAFTRPNQWNSATRYEARGERPLTTPRRNAERRAWTTSQDPSIHPSYQAPGHVGTGTGLPGKMNEGSLFAPSGSSMTGGPTNPGFRKGQWGGNPMMTQSINGERVPGEDFLPKVDHKSGAFPSKSIGQSSSTPQMTEHKPYKGFVLDPRLSEMAVKPGGWIPPKETSAGIKIPRRPSYRSLEPQVTPTVSISRTETHDGPGASYPWREAPELPLSGNPRMSVEEELARKRARTRAFLPAKETGQKTRMVASGATHAVNESNERVRPNEGVRPAGLAEGGPFIPPRKELVG